MSVNFVRHIIEHAVFLPIRARPFYLGQMTTAQRNALTPVNGLSIYNTTTNQYEFYQAGAWITFAVFGAHAPSHEPGGVDEVTDIDILNTGVLLSGHEARHVDGGLDEIDAALDARAIALVNQGEIVFRAAAANVLAALPVGVAGQALLTGGPAADPSWGAPTPAAHVLATTGPHTGTLPLTDLVVGVRGNIIHRGAVDWAALAVGAAGQALLSGGAGADVSWGAPAPAAHEATHVSGGADDIDSALDGRAITLTTQGDIVYAGGVNTLARLAAGVVGDLLQSGGAGANPSWTRQIDLNMALADHAFTGYFITDTVGENVVIGDVLYMKNDGKWWQADSDAATTMPGAAMATETILADASGKLLIIGLIRDDSWTWTIGATSGLLYVHTTPGNPTQTVPSGSGDQVQILGIAITTAIILFNPSYELVGIS